MELAGDYAIPAPPARVWSALNDPATLKACIPGCKELQQLSPTEFASTVAARVGPVGATFKGTVTLSDLDPPHGYTIAGQGQGAGAGFVKARARVRLFADGAGTHLHYDARADVGGKLANVGSRLVQGAARKVADDFFQNLTQRLAAEGAATPARKRVPPPPSLGRWLWAIVALSAAVALAVLIAD